MIRFGLVFLLMVGGAAAAPLSCGQMVGGLQSYLRDHPQQTGTRPQTQGAQLNHQPTAAAVAAAKQDSRENLVAMLAKAKAQQSAGDAEGCRATLRGVAWMVRP